MSVKQVRYKLIHLLSHMYACSVNYGQNVDGKTVVLAGIQHVVGRVGKVWLNSCEYKRLHI
jgi:hypothetical protein